MESWCRIPPPVICFGLVSFWFWFVLFPGTGAQTPTRQMLSELHATTLELAWLHNLIPISSLYDIPPITNASSTSSLRSALSGRTRLGIFVFLAYCFPELWPHRTTLPLLWQNHSLPSLVHAQGRHFTSVAVSVLFSSSENFFFP